MGTKSAEQLREWLEAGGVMAFRRRYGSFTTKNHQNLQFLKSSKVEMSNSHKQRTSTISAKWRGSGFPVAGDVRTD